MNPSSRHTLTEELALLRARIAEVEAQLEFSASDAVASDAVANDAVANDAVANDAVANDAVVGSRSPVAADDSSENPSSFENFEFGYWEWDIVENRSFMSEQLGLQENGQQRFKEWKSLVHPEDYPGTLRLLKTHLRGESEFYESLFRMRTRSGEWHWILSKGRVVSHGADGQPLRMIGVHIDVHDLHMDKELMHQLAEHLGDGIWLASARPHHLLYANPAFTQLLGDELRHWINKPLRFLLAFVHPEDRGRVRRSFRSALKDGRFEESFRILRPDTEIAHVLVRSFPIYGDNGEITRISGSVQDVSELTSARREKASLEEQLLHAQRIESIGRLTGGIAHDFNNILTAILGNVTLLKASLLRGRNDLSFLQSGLEHIERAGRDASDLTRQLLAFGRREASEPEVLTPELILDDLQRILKRLIRESILLEINCDPDCWFLEADASSIKQVILNLAVNASDAMPRGGQLSIEARNHCIEEEQLAELAQSSESSQAKHFGAEVRPGHYVCFTVSDTGSGIPPEILEQVFDPFFTTKNLHLGTGLGLSIVHGIVTQSGGHLRMESVPGLGSTFQVFLPALSSEAAQQRLHRQPESEKLLGQLLHQAPSDQCQHILVCEDQAAVLDLTARVLEHGGYRVTRARDAKQALAAHAQHRDLDLLVTDAVLPGASGTKLAHTLWHDQPELPVLLMSGYPEEEISLREFGESEIPLLRKPFEPHQLLKLVQELLGQESPEPQ
ncbi:MAG: hypothetical protein CSA62_01750 [Planctomycetota bacterium]|nr:MAG: hypothetical protein CSA62_01750 [Planctomycetota bacterium]